MSCDGFRRRSDIGRVPAACLLVLGQGIHLFAELAGAPKNQNQASSHLLELASKHHRLFQKDQPMYTECLRFLVEEQIGLVICTGLRRATGSGRKPPPKHHQTDSSALQLIRRLNSFFFTGPWGVAKAVRLNIGLDPQNGQSGESKKVGEQGMRQHIPSGGNFAGVGRTTRSGRTIPRRISAPKISHLPWFGSMEGPIPGIGLGHEESWGEGANQPNHHFFCCPVF